jgi:hypothetical protein
MDNYLVSLTTIPRRFNTTLPVVIESIKKQTIRCKIIVNIPYKYLKWNNEIIIPEYLLQDPDIIINRTNIDYGPATKLLGAIEYVDRMGLNDIIKYIVTVDDDIEYVDKQFIEYFVNVMDIYPNYVVPIASIKLVNHPYHCNDGLSYNNIGFVDAPCGYKGVLYPIHRFNMDRFFMKKKFIDTLPIGIVNDDDSYFGIIMGIMNIPIYVITNTMQYNEAVDSEGSAVQSNVSVNRMTNESTIYQDAVVKGYLPNKNK